ncbi:MAG: Maf family nucleotide pyrophosphatase [Sphingomonadaceae bacterium]|nr:Maf family nucleotide pyrophosphatase [Sphingomonadaceae bacterium]
MIVLASQSGSRKAMLEAAGIAFEAQPADIDERQLEASLGATAPPASVAVALARAKAEAVSCLRPGELILGSDSLVEVEGRRFDKPRSREEAVEHLRFFSGKVLQLHSAAALVRDGECLWQDHARSDMQVIDLSNDYIESYLEHEWPEVSACVGVFRIEGRGVQLFEAIEGDQFTVLGMPLLKVLGALRNLGEIAS